VTIRGILCVTVCWIFHSDWLNCVIHVPKLLTDFTHVTITEAFHDISAFTFIFYCIERPLATGYFAEVSRSSLPRPWELCGEMRRSQSGWTEERSRRELSAASHSSRSEYSWPLSFFFLSCSTKYKHYATSFLHLRNHSVRRRMFILIFDWSSKVLHGCTNWNNIATDRTVEVVSRCSHTW